jgi:four helix bundle protein
MMGIVEEEADECLFWMELLIDARLVQAKLMQGLMNEANEIVSIVVASIRTARKRWRKGEDLGMQSTE